jgi:molybdopterin molybdotransferase
MLTIEEALKVFERIEGIKRTETLPLWEGLGRVLAEPVFSKIDHPPFTKSAMDGYAVSSITGARDWALVETIAAGAPPRVTVGPGTCSKIMTGAMLPQGADAVVMVEHTEVRDGRVFMIRGDLTAGDNVSPRGEDAKAGDLVLEPGCLITPQVLGSLAACGWDRVAVYDRPRVHVVTTGDEIVLPGEALKPGQIYNSNGFSLCAQYQAMGCDVQFAGVAADDLASLKQTLGEILAKTDVLIISGGVSMGDFDFVPRAIEELGGKIGFAKVAIKPGKPTLFATHGERLIFGLPGNPVSTFIITEILVKPAMYRFMNLREVPPQAEARLTRTVSRRKADRTAFIPVSWQGDQVSPIEYHGSAHLLALPRANGLIRLDIGVTELSEGSRVRVRLIQS